MTQKIELVFAKTNAAIGDRRVDYGSHWPANDPLVLENPSLFSDDPRVGMSCTAPVWETNPVEQVTAGPGEVRGRVKRG